MIVFVVLEDAFLISYEKGFVYQYRGDDCHFKISNTSSSIKGF